MRIGLCLGVTFLVLTPWACATAVVPEGGVDLSDAGAGGQVGIPGGRGGTVGNNPGSAGSNTGPVGNSGSGGQTSSGGMSSGGMSSGGSGGSSLGGSAGAVSGGVGGTSGDGGSSSAGTAGTQVGQGGTGGSGAGCGVGGDPCACPAWVNGTEYGAPNDIATVTCVNYQGAAAPCGLAEYRGKQIAVRCSGSVEQCKYENPNGNGLPVWEFVEEC